MSQQIKNKFGFTLIELMLAMSFVSVLLIAVAMTVIQISNIYNKGLLLKGANQSGIAIVSELKRSISSSPQFDVDPGTTKIYVQRDWGGRLCTGQYSYIWNYGAAITSDNNPTPTKGLSDNRNIYISPNAEIRFVKIYDPALAYCTPTNNVYPNISTDAIELLNASQYDLAIQKFSISSSAFDSKTGQRLYNIEFFIGTNNQKALNNSTSCKAPNETGSDPSYCSVVQFNITARAGNLVE